MNEEMYMLKFVNIVIKKCEVMGPLFTVACLGGGCGCIAALLTVLFPSFNFLCSTAMFPSLHSKCGKYIFHDKNDDIIMIISAPTVSVYFIRTTNRRRPSAS